MSTRHSKLVEGFANRASKKYKPKPLPKLPELRRSSSTKENDSFKSSSPMDRVKRIFSVTVGDVIESVKGEKVLQGRVPILKLRKAVRDQFLMVLEACYEKAIFVSTRQVNDYRYLIDFGGGHVMEIYVTNCKEKKKEKTAEIAAKESDRLDFFDPIPESQRIKSANVVNDAGEQLKPQ